MACPRIFANRILKELFQLLSAQVILPKQQGAVNEKEKYKYQIK